MKHLWGVRWNGVILPRSILPHSAILLKTYHVPRLEITHYVNYDIARCSVKWWENANKRYIIIFNHIQRFYLLISQSSWCQNALKLIYQKAEIPFLWDTQNVFYCKFDFYVWRWTVRWQKSMDVKIDPRLAFFFKRPCVQFCPHVPFCPDFL